MARASEVTVDHDKIKNWVEARGGHPAHVKGTGGSDDAGLLRIDFPGFAGENTLEEVPWEDFFQTFEDNGLAFLYQEETKDGEESRFCKFISRSSVEADKAS